MNYLSLDDFIQITKQTISGKKLYLVGAGGYGSLFGKFFEKEGIPFEAYIDMRDTSDTLNGKKIFQYSKVCPDSNDYYFITSRIYFNEMKFRLLKLGVKEQFLLSQLDSVLYDELEYKTLPDINLVSKLSYFKNRYKGQRCFIIGNGPSLTIQDLNKLSNEKCFACNGIYRLYDYTQWRPNFYFAFDSNFLRMMLDSELGETLLENSEYLFFSIFSRQNNPWIKINKDNDKIFYIYLKKNVSNFEVSDKCDEYVCPGGGVVTFIMLQMAAFMGFSKIYLLGIDFTFSEIETKHGKIIIQPDLKIIENGYREHNNAYEKSIELYSCGNNLDRKTIQLQSYEAVKKYYDVHGVEIYNATRCGELEVFPRVDFDSLF